MTDNVRPRIDRYLSETGLAARGREGRPADRGRLRPAIPSHPSPRRAVTGPGGVSTGVRRRATPLCQRRAPDGGDAGARAGDPGTFERAGHPGAAGSGRRHAAGASRRCHARRACRVVPPGGHAHRQDATARARPGIRPVPAVRHRVRRREALVGAPVLRQAFPRSVPRRGAHSRRTSGARHAYFCVSPKNWPPSRGCSVIATITAAT